MWAELDEDSKQPYIDLAFKDKARYVKELKQFNSLGYFINQYGYDSRDLYLQQVKRPKKMKNLDLNVVQQKVVKSENISKNGKHVSKSEKEANSEMDESYEE